MNGYYVIRHNTEWKCAFSFINNLILTPISELKVWKPTGARLFGTMYPCLLSPSNARQHINESPVRCRLQNECGEHFFVQSFSCLTKLVIWLGATLLCLVPEGGRRGQWSPAHAPKVVFHTARRLK